MTKGRKTLLTETAVSVRDFLACHQISVHLLARIAGLDDMRIRRFLDLNWTKGPSHDFFVRLLRIADDRPNFWPENIKDLLTRSRDYYTTFGI